MTFVLKLQGLEAPAETDSIAAPSNVLSNYTITNAGGGFTVSPKTASVQEGATAQFTASDPVRARNISRDMYRQLTEVIGLVLCPVRGFGAAGWLIEQDTTLAAPPTTWDRDWLEERPHRVAVHSGRIATSSSCGWARRSPRRALSRPSSPCPSSCSP